MDVIISYACGYFVIDKYFLNLFHEICFTEVLSARELNDQLSLTKNICYFN